MTDQTPSGAAEPFYMRLWGKIPVIIRAPVLGIGVFLLLQMALMFLMLNFEHMPEVPWSAPLILIYLCLGWMYFAGRGWPRATSKARRQNMRVEPRSRKRTLWGYAAAVLVLTFIIGLAIVTSSLIQFPEGSFTPPEYFSRSPELTTFVFILCFALVAGVSEEVGFRGYMQVPLEKRYGVVWAVAITAVLFWLAHFEHANVLYRTPFLLGTGVFAGFLASYSRSLGPVILLHFAADTIGFTMVSRLFGLEPLYRLETIWQTGVTPEFTQAVVLTAGAGVVSTLMLIRMAKMKD